MHFTLVTWIVLITQAINLAVLGAMQGRNIWFIREAEKLNNDEYLRLPSFHQLYWRFWRWDLKKLLREAPRD